MPSYSYDVSTLYSFNFCTLNLEECLQTRAITSCDAWEVSGSAVCLHGFLKHQPHMRGSDAGGREENTVDSLVMLWNDDLLNSVNLLFFWSVVGLNVFGLLVTQVLGSVFRAVMLTARTASVRPTVSFLKSGKFPKRLLCRALRLALAHAHCSPDSVSKVSQYALAKNAFCILLSTDISLDR